jgi:hypothetical protein
MSRMELKIRFFGPDHKSQAFADKFEVFEDSLLDDYTLQVRQPTLGSPAHKSWLREIERRRKLEK